MAKENLLPLKVLVISLGILLVGGFALVIGVVFSRLGGQQACTRQPVELPVAGTVESAGFAQGTWTVALRRPDGTIRLMAFDECTGAMRHSLILKPEGAR
jgi:hypothetical protein